MIGNGVFDKTAKHLNIIQHQLVSKCSASKTKIANIFEIPRDKSEASLVPPSPTSSSSDDSAEKSAASLSLLDSTWV